MKFLPMAAVLVAAMTSLPASAAPAPATLEDFMALCPALLFDRPSLRAAQQETGLKRIDNSPLAFGWGTQTFTNPERDRAVVVTLMKFGDAERSHCVAELERQLDFKEIEAVKARLEALPSIGPLDGKIYPYPAGETHGVLKREGREPLSVVTFAAAGGRTVLSIDVWKEKTR